MVFSKYCVKWRKDLDVQAHFLTIFEDLCAGKIPGLPAGAYAVKVGGSLGRLIEVRPASPRQYPPELYEDIIIHAVSSLPNAETGAKAEQAAIGAPGVQTVNKKQKVSAHEHNGADAEALGSTLYMKVVRRDVANSKAAFRSAWRQHKASNPDKYRCTLRQNHMTEFILGTDKFSLGTDKFSLGTDKFSLGTDMHSLGTDTYSLGTDKVSLGTDKFSLGTDKFSLGTDMKSLGTDKVSLGTNNAMGPAAGTKYRKETLPRGNLPAILKMLRKSFSNEELHVVFNEKNKSAGVFPSSGSSSSLHHLCNQESSPETFKGVRFRSERFKGLQKVFNDESK